MIRFPIACKDQKSDSMRKGSSYFKAHEQLPFPKAMPKHPIFLGG